MLASTYAFIRVSTAEQNEARQVIAMTTLGISEKNIVVEKESGKSTTRTKYHRLIKSLKTGDTLYIENIDRLGRDYETILNEWHLITVQKKVVLKVLDTPMLDTDQVNDDLQSKFMQNIYLHIQAFQAEYEWQKIKNRQAQGIAIAKASGKSFGRPKSILTEKEIKTARQYLSREITLDIALKMLKIKKSAFYKLCNTVKNI